ncbi:MAG: hypothetical protein KF832_22990 [Caldilineaceae bacterium]|nr:hypothetical protein [Caldilineaceae bacterium]
MRILTITSGLVLLLILILFSSRPGAVMPIVLGASITAPADFVPLSDIAQVATGGFHTCARTNGGAIKCWGANDYGQLGDNSNTARNLPVDPIGLSNVSVIVTGAYHTCALLATGSVRCWGDNELGQLGDGTQLNRRLPTEVQGLGSGIVGLAAGDYHTCAFSSSNIFCWGKNEQGQLGDATQLQRSTPVTVGNLAGNITAVAAGAYQTCAITAGAVRCWGDNTWGQLGNGSNTASLLPTNVSNLGSGATALAVGGEYACALVNGSVRCWGMNSDGQLGDGTETDSNVPVTAFNLSSGVATISGGEKHVCAVTTSGGVKCWGRNAHGQAGAATAAGFYLTIPANVTGLTSGATAVAAGGHHTCARLANSSLKCWGVGESGQLGDGVNYLYSTPVAVTGVSGSVSSLALGGSHSCALIDGAAQCWGSNEYLQLGNPVVGASPLPVAVNFTGGTFTALATGLDHSCGRTSIGALVCWGGNYWGQLGLGHTDYTDQLNSPAGLTAGVTAFAAGYAHTCAVVNGTTQCWGQNNYGQLGTGNTVDSSTPVDVSGLQPNEVVALAASGDHTCALTTTSSVKCWGHNGFGELGSGSTSESESTPVTVAGLANDVLAITAGLYHSCARFASAVQCWGRNDLGQLGDNSNQDRLAPVAVVELSGAIQALVTGYDHNCVLAAQGGRQCWGANEKGQLGDGSYSNRRAPVSVTGLAGSVALMSAGRDHTCAALSQGGLQCWGSTVYGQLGSGQVAWRHTPADVLIPGSAVVPTVTHTPTTPPSNGTPAPTVTPTATTQPGQGDVFEDDNSCAQAKPIATDGTLQQRTFHAPGDVDWVQFTATAAITYVVEARVPAMSGADLILEVYDNCAGGAQQSQDHTFSPDVRLRFSVPSDRTIYLRLLNADPTKAGPQVAYHLTVRALSSTPQIGAVIIVAGRYKVNDPLQSQIHALTKRAYQLWRANGYGPERIRYLASELGIDADNDGVADVAALATRANLQAAITQWAADKVGADRSLTIYLMDHGGYDKFYLDGPRNEVLTPQDLHSWLTQLEAIHPNLSINIIIEACYSGSFIDPNQSISAPNRVVVASTGAFALAWASQQGAVFSDALFDSLTQGSSLLVAFEEARTSARSRNSAQVAWLDDDGDGIPNGANDGQVAGLRSFTVAGTFPADNAWPPYVVQAEIRNSSGERKEIWAEVRDNENAVRAVWAVIYPPSYQIPTSNEELVAEPLPLPLLARGNDQYAALYGQFTESGTYRIVIYAEDDEGLTARPVELVISSLYLPVITR